MASNFAKRDKFEGVDFKRWQKKMNFLLFSMSVVYVLNTLMPKDGGDNPTVEQVRKRAEWDNDDYVCRGLILNGMFDFLFHIYLNVETSKELWDTLEAKYMAEDASSKKFLVSNFTNYKMTDSRSVLEQYNEHLGILGRFTQHKMNMDEYIQVSCIIDKLPPSWKDFKHTLKHLNEELTLINGLKAVRNQGWRLDEGGASCDARRFVEPWVESVRIIELGSHLRIEESPRAQDNDKPNGNNVAGPSVVNVEHNNSSRYNDNRSKRKHHDTKADPNKKPKDDDVAWWVESGATMHVCKDRCWFKTYESLNDGSILHMGNKSTSLHARLGHVHFKRMQDMYKDGFIPAFDMDTEKCKTCMLTKITKKPFQNVKRETEVLELVHSDLCDVHATPSLGNKKYFVTFIDDASRFCYVYLLHSNNEALDKFKVFKTEVELQQGTLIKRFRTDRGGEYMDTLYFQYVCIIHETTTPYTPQQNGISKRKNRVKEGLNASLLDMGDAIFDENRFSSVPRPSQRYLVNGTEDSGGSVVPEKVTEDVVLQHEPQLRKRKRHRTPKDFGPEFLLYLIEGTRDEMDSIIGNNTWVLTDLPPGCKWIFKIKLKVDGTVEKFKARLVIQGFKQKSGIYYFDTYAPVIRVSTIRLLIVVASIHSLIIHQMDVKRAFLNGELEEEVYMNQPLGFILPGNENKVCKLVKSLYELKQAPNKFHASGKGVIICLYVDDILIFGTGQVQVDLTKEFLSSRFSMKDIGEADIILGIRIKHESNGIAISQSHYIENVLKKFNYSDCTPVSTPLDTCEKLMPNRGLAVSQLEYSRVIGCLMYAITCTRSDIAFAVGKLSRYTSNPVLEGYTDASWISNTEDNSSTSGWVFLLAGGAISWASKKQTCITGSTMEFEFVALAAASKKAEWLKNLLLEIPLWVKPMELISIRCDSAATLAKAYSQMYNGKSRHLSVRHSMIRELITNGVVSIEFVRSQQNLTDHLTKGLARDMVIKSAEGMGLKSN
ncbi:zinc finger, CCHC-type containing protein [Tanacetum coccineum]